MSHHIISLLKMQKRLKHSNDQWQTWMFKRRKSNLIHLPNSHNCNVHEFMLIIWKIFGKLSKKKWIKCIYTNVMHVLSHEY